MNDLKRAYTSFVSGINYLLICGGVYSGERR